MLTPPPRHRTHSYFGSEFAHGTDVVTIKHRDGACEKKVEVWSMPKLWRFSLQDPFDETHDLGTVLSDLTWQSILNELRATAVLLRKNGGDIAALVLAAERGGAGNESGSAKSKGKAQKGKAKAAVKKQPDLRTTMKKPDLRTTMFSVGTNLLYKVGGKKSGGSRKVLKGKLRKQRRLLSGVKALQKKPMGELKHQEREKLARLPAIERKIAMLQGELDAIGAAPAAPETAEALIESLVSNAEAFDAL